MRDASEYATVVRAIVRGASDADVAHRTGVPRETVRDWRRRHREGSPPGARLRSRQDCPFCGDGQLEAESYGYLLGLYLGDGFIAHGRRGVYCLRITLDRRYPEIIEECSAAMAATRPPGTMRVGTAQRTGCTVVQGYWKHWPCLFPQHGPGAKHLRRIELTEWQRCLVDADPPPLHHRRMNARTVVVARREDVGRLDAFVGRKS